MNSLFFLRKIIKEELDKMSSIDLQGYFKKNSNNKEWIDILSKFPEELQREIIDERREGSKEDIEEIKNWILLDNKPKTVNIKNILNNNLDILNNLPQEVLDVINKKWNLNAKTVKVYDQNPKRYFEYAKMSSLTAKPSVMVDGELYWGIGRFVSALLRGDQKIQVWDLRNK